MDRNLRLQAREVLTAKGWLSGQTAAFQDELFDRGVVQRHQPGGYLYRVGDPPGGIYGLVAGVIVASFGMGDLPPHMISYGEPGRWAGANTWFTGSDRISELRAIEDSVVMHLPLSAMQAMADRDPAAAKAFGQIIVANLESLFEILCIYSLGTSEQRVAAVLIRASRHGSVSISVTHEMLAPLANSSIRQVSAATRKLVRSGAIRQHYRSIEVLDRSQLVRAAAGNVSGRIGALDPLSDPG